MSMRFLVGAVLLGLASLTMSVRAQQSAGEGSGPAVTARTYYGEVHLGRPLAFRLQRVPRGDVAGHDCLRGSYTHVYRGAGFSGQEVWLCCVPVDEILSDAFRCAAGAFPPVLGSSEYLKISHCSLQHPTAAQPTYIPVCIPAPVRAPDIDR
jgi:hypothetical protein